MKRGINRGEEVRRGRRKISAVGRAGVLRRSVSSRAVWRKRGVLVGHSTIGEKGLTTIWIAVPVQMALPEDAHVWNWAEELYGSNEIVQVRGSRSGGYSLGQRKRLNLMRAATGSRWSSLQFGGRPHKPHILDHLKELDHKHRCIHLCGSPTRLLPVAGWYAGLGDWY